MDVLLSIHIRYCHDYVDIVTSIDFPLLDVHWQLWYQIFLSSVRYYVRHFIRSKIVSQHLLSMFDFSLPWDQSTLVGYFAEIFCVWHNGQVYLLAVGAVILFLISICYHHHAFYQIFKHSVDKINNFDENRKHEDVLRNLIRFHMLVKE